MSLRQVGQRGMDRAGSADKHLASNVVLYMGH